MRTFIALSIVACLWVPQPAAAFSLRPVAHAIKKGATYAVVAAVVGI